MILTDRYVHNLQAKLYRGVQTYLGTDGMHFRGVTFHNAINSVNQHHPDNGFSRVDVRNIRLLLAEKGIYKGNSPWYQITMHEVSATTPDLNHRNISDMSKRYRRVVKFSYNEPTL